MTDNRIIRLLQRAEACSWPSPVGVLSEQLISWLRDSGPTDPSGVSRYLTELWRERPDLQEEYPGIAFDPVQRDNYLRWTAQYAAAESNVPKYLMPAPPPSPATDALESVATETPVQTGVTVVGYLRAQLGLGAAARRMVSLCTMAEPIVQAIPYDHVQGAFSAPWPDIASESIQALDVALLCVNGSETRHLVRSLGSSLRRSTYRIGLWFWELSELPDSMAVGFDHVDEIWVTSAFVADAISRRLREQRRSLRVEVVPMGATVPSPNDNEFKTLCSAPGVPDGLVVGCVFDYNSRIERKNPVGAIHAFCRAFPKPFEFGEALGPRLVIKAHGGARHHESRRVINELIDNRPDIVLLDKNFTEAQQHAFYRGLDAYVSLHRSEGYGLAPLEAMANNVPTIATAYSGNLEFMTENNSWLIPYTMSAVPPDCAPYPAGAAWAEPDVGAAAEILRTVIVDRDSDAVRARCLRAGNDMKSLVSGHTGAAWIRQRLNQIRAQRR
jgi:glycosyltransferase involved in cell wall biosynthesis